MSKLLGEVFAFAGNGIPTNCMSCNGAVLNITANPALFAVIGANYGGDGVTTFGLPDLRSRSVVGASGTVDPPLTPYSLGSYGGGETLSGSSPTDTGNIVTAEEGSTFDIQNPFLSLFYCIVVAGDAPF